MLVSEFKDSNNIFFFPCDVTSKQQVEATYSKIVNTISKVDVLINNAGVSKFAPFIDLTYEDFEYMNNVNYKGVFLCSKAVLPAMIEKKNGIIINILTWAAINIFQNSSVYSGSKAAAWVMMKTLREEVRIENIKVINIHPGATESDMWEESERKEFGFRMMQPEDVAEAVYTTLMLSDTNSRAMIEEIIIRPQLGDL